MRLFNFLNESEGRSQPINKEKAIGLLKEHCQQAIKNDVRIQRYITENYNDFLFIDPSKFNRMSVGTSNYYTIVLDNLPSWKEYPKRSKSVIGSINRPLNDNLFMVFPYDNAKIGICPTDDLWYSFDAFIGLARFNNIINHIGMILKIGHKLNNNMSINELYSIFDEFDKRKSEYIDNHDLKLMLGDNFWQKYFETDITLKELIKESFDPNKNGFKLLKVNNLPPYHSGKDKEIWTDSPCVMIKNSEVKEILGEIK